jgi:hypothetical protein
MSTPAKKSTDRAWFFELLMREAKPLSMREKPEIYD